MENNIWNRNTASGNGGALSIVNLAKPGYFVDFYNNNFSNNAANGAGSAGGSVYFQVCCDAQLTYGIFRSGG